MRHRLPSAIASAIQTAHGQHTEGNTPDTPFQPAQASLLADPPSWRDWLAELLAHAAPVLQYLSSTNQELRDAAQVLPWQLHELSQHEPHPGADARLVAAAERRFGEPVPGQTLAAQAARVRDAGYWRRFLVRRVREARERLHLQLGLVGAGARQYCSEGAREHRQMQLVKQDEWLKNTMLRGFIDGKLVELPLAQVVKGAHQKLSKLYAFVAAMDRLAVDAGLTVALLTTTLEGEWHANPEFKRDGHRWNGAFPREANRELGQRFQDIRRDLDKQGIKLSGLWAGEPHADGCPHRHHWLMYDPQHERAVFAAFLRYFPGKLKVRRDKRDGGDIIIDTREDALHGLHRKLRRKEGAQVDVSIIDRSKGSGASYVLKYVMKAVLPELSYEGLAAPLGEAAPERSTKKRSAAEARKELRTLQSVSQNAPLEQNARRHGRPSSTSPRNSAPRPRKTPSVTADGCLGGATFKVTRLAWPGTSIPTRTRLAIRYRTLTPLGSGQLASRRIEESVGGPTAHAVTGSLRSRRDSAPVQVVDLGLILSKQCPHMRLEVRALLPDLLLLSALRSKVQRVQ